MAEEKRKFSFDDDTLEIKKEELKVKSNSNLRPESSQKFSFEDDEEIVVESEPIEDTIPDAKEFVEEVVEEIEDEEEVMPKTKKKLRLKKWHIALIILFTIFLAFIIYVFVATQNDGPVYGNRCASLLTIDNSKFSEIETTIKQNEAIEDIKIEVDCRIVKLSITYVDNTPAATAEELAAIALHTFDDAMGYQKDEGAGYSQLFGKANGKGQYNAEFYLRSSGDSDFPIFGTKHPSGDGISFTGVNPANQATTDAVNQNEAENNAETAQQ